MDNTERITELVDKLLELSDANSQTVIERSDKVKAIQIAQQAVKQSGIVEQNRLQFTLQATPENGELTLLTNLQKACRVLVLLLHNARKFTKKGSVTLSIERQGAYVCFMVTDTGIGIPAEEAQNIFEEFVQLDEYYDGAGIGLTVARSLARRMGGDVTLDTTYTEGARFAFKLPTA